MSNAESKDADSIDSEGYRANVGMIICNTEGKVFWGRRLGQAGWQFPQGGINPDEEPVDAMYRELEEEVGLAAHQVNLLGHTDSWLKYRLPIRYRRGGIDAKCIGQKQIWYLLQHRGDDQDFNFELFDEPEFEEWQWVNYWYPINHVIYFKRSVYKRALKQLECFNTSLLTQTD